MSIENPNIHAGSKFFRYIDDREEPEIIRIRKVDKLKNKVGFYDSEWNKLSMSFTELTDTYKMLRADGMVIFSIVSVSEVSDVIVALKSLDLDKIGDPLPYAVCRQSIFDFFSNMTKSEYDQMCTGISVSQDTCPADINFSDVLSCDSVQYSKPVLVYLDDTLEDILRFVKHKKFDDVLISLREASIKNFKSRVNKYSYNTTLKELMELNNFMYDFRKCFNILEVPFHIDEERDTLDYDNIQFLNKELSINIMETYLLEYTREIDLRTIKRDYRLISSAADKFSKVYILGYDKADE